MVQIHANFMGLGPQGARAQPQAQPLTAPEAIVRYGGIGSVVVDLIFSIAKREVTFLSGMAAIRRL